MIMALLVSSDALVYAKAYLTMPDAMPDDLRNALWMALMGELPPAYQTVLVYIDQDADGVYAMVHDEKYPPTCERREYMALASETGV